MTCPPRSLAAQGNTSMGETKVNSRILIYMYAELSSHNIGGHGAGNDQVKT